MTAVLAPSVTVILFRQTGESVYLVTGWPDRLRISTELMHQLGRERVSLRYPYLTIRVENGQATYRVETLDLGAWTGALVEAFGPCSTS